MAHEAFHFLKSNRFGKQGKIAVKLDLSKACDRVEWDFLCEVLLKLGFDAKWVQLMFQCFSTVKFKVVVNGSERCSFYPSRGLR